MIPILLYLTSLLLSLAGLGYAILWLRRLSKALREAALRDADLTAEANRMQKASRVSALEARAAWVEVTAAMSEAQLIRWLDASQPAKDAMLKVEVRLFRAMRYLETHLAREPSVPLCQEITLESLTTEDHRDARIITLDMQPAQTPSIQSKAVAPIRVSARRVPLLAKTQVS
ncbi:hypothetical protein [Metallibacterium scheffleri]|nr:hypothetical protein [Metallibacterium scheffleri]